MTHKDPQVLASNDSYKQECTHKSWLNGEYFLSPEDENKLQLESDQKKRHWKLDGPLCMNGNSFVKTCQKQIWSGAKSKILAVLTDKKTI